LLNTSYRQIGLRFCWNFRKEGCPKSMDLQSIPHLIPDLPGPVFSFPLFLCSGDKFSRSRQNSEDEALQSFTLTLLYFMKLLLSATASSELL